MKKNQSAANGISSPVSITQYVKKENINPSTSETYFSNQDNSSALTNDLTVMIRDYKSENFKFS
jgi:hypothetical protein